MSAHTYTTKQSICGALISWVQLMASGQGLPHDYYFPKYTHVHAHTHTHATCVCVSVCECVNM